MIVLNTTDIIYDDDEYHINELIAYDDDIAIIVKYMLEKFLLSAKEIINELYNNN